MNIYIRTIKGQIVDDWIFAANLGSQLRGLNVILFDDITKVPKDKFVITFIDETIEYFKICKVNIPPPLNIPNELLEYTKRTINNMSFKSFLDGYITLKFPLFIKPSEKLKSFPSGVINNKSSIPYILNDVTDFKQEIMISTVVEMVSEYRCFVFKGELIGLKHYLGNFELFPNIATIKEMIYKYKSAPISYSLDVAINNNNETILVECNDAWSLGNYGFDCQVYIKFLFERWREIFKLSDKQLSL